MLKFLSPYLGTIVNFAVVLILGTLGSFIKKGIPKRITESIMAAMAICVVYIGIDGILEKAPDVSEVSILPSGLFKVLVMIISMAIGTLIGELIDLDKWMNRLGNIVAVKLSGKGSREDFAKGFANCSILFCVGAMTINGAIASASGNHDLLLTKSVIDGVSVLVMASSLGIGCAFSAFFLLLYQGSITFFAGFLVKVLSAATLTYMSVTGSLVVILIGTNVLGITKVKTVNMVPSMFVAIGAEALLKLIF